MNLGPAEGQWVIVRVTAGGPMQLHQCPFVYCLRSASGGQRRMILVLDEDIDRITPACPLIVADGECKRQGSALGADLRGGKRRLHRCRVREGHGWAVSLHP